MNETNKQTNKNKKNKNREDENNENCLPQNESLFKTSNKKS